MALALALATVTAAAGAATPPAAVVSRSRFLANVKLSPPLSYYDCTKKPPSVCLEPGSPGTTCCNGTCVDTASSFAYCGNCNKTCKFGQTCCGGHCVDLLNDSNNCGDCFVQCPKTKCNFGLCGYAG
ncbi:hypothetical protein GUJ93_ZPchr0001g32310 [Zizania palustris]|uniref:Uncharacterized protein n=1 Tax=Zizania palustris TaxID=103762 RepID=A0A8J5S0F0_ZIZPA|nr:hypothetical protein GUJ93_ZPchr0001g32310 [Zizania palustris]